MASIAVTATAAAGAVAIAACSSSVGAAPGAVMITIDTNLKVPDDVDAVGIEVSLAADAGTIYQDNVYDVAPNGDAVFPATFAVVRGTDQPVAIRVVGYKDGAAVTLRDAITTLPPDRTAVLRMPIDWLDKGSAVAATTAKDQSTVTQTSTPLPSTLASSCPQGTTSIAGTCTSFDAESLTQTGDGGLPTFDPSAFTSSENPATCLDMDACFPRFDEGALDVKLDKGTCSFVPTMDPSKMNVAMRLGPVGNGWGNGYGHVIPIGQDPTDGWHLGTNGAVLLPAAVCTNPKVLAVVTTAVSASCPFKSVTTPACQSYPDASSTNPPAILDGGDATVQMASDGGDDGDAASDAAAPDAAFDDTTYSLDLGAAPIGLAVDDVHTYIVTNFNAAIFLSATDTAFDAGSAHPQVHLALDISSPTAQVSAFRQLVAIHGDDSFQVVDTTTNQFTDAGVYDDMAVGSNLTAFLTDAGVDYAVASCTGILCVGQPDGSVSKISTNVILSLGLDPNTLSSGSPVPSFAAFGATSKDVDAVNYGPLDPSTGFVDDPTVASIPNGGQPLQFAFPDDSHIVWSSHDTTVCYSGKTTSSDDGVCFGSDASTAQGTLAGGGGSIFWVDGAGAVNRASFAGRTPAAGAGGTVLPIATAPVTALALLGNELYWISGTSVFRRDVRSIP